jgi:S-adenosylmethionine:tRNA ribosyltransferase-isomerase
VLGAGLLRAALSGQVDRLGRSPPLERGEAGVDAAPAGADEIDEEAEVVHAGVPLGEKLALEVLEAPDRLVQKTADLGDVAPDRQHLRADRVVDGCRDRGRDLGFELGGHGSESLGLLARALERGLEVRGVGSPGRVVGEPLLRPLESQFFHRRRGYSQRRMDTAVLEYDLPRELIAQTPSERRDASRLLVWRRSAREVEHRRFSDLPDVLDRELLVVNDTRVVPARLRLTRESGGAVEVLLLERCRDAGTWEGLVRPARRLRTGEQLGAVELLEPLGGGRWRLRLDGEPSGEVPLPPYIREPIRDPERYQTVYAQEPGSAAAPTAGLHFSEDLLRKLDYVRVTLHVGLDTFQPVKAERLEEHALHGERYRVEADAWTRVESAERVLAVGTTAVRVVETVAHGGELQGRTQLYVTPGFEFRRVDALLTNLHLPRSTPLALVMAFAGIEETRELYRTAIAERYRFYSFGDAMLVL